MYRKLASFGSPQRRRDLVLVDFAKAAPSLDHSPGEHLEGDFSAEAEKFEELFAGAFVDVSRAEPGAPCRKVTNSSVARLEHRVVLEINRLVGLFGVAGDLPIHPPALAPVGTTGNAGGLLQLETAGVAGGRRQYQPKRPGGDRHQNRTTHPADPHGDPLSHPSYRQPEVVDKGEAGRFWAASRV